MDGQGWSHPQWNQNFFWLTLVPVCLTFSGTGCSTEKFPCSALKRKMDITTADSGSSDSIINYKRSWATYQTTHFRLLAILSKPLFSTTQFYTNMEGVLFRSLTASNSPAIFQDSNASFILSLGLCCSEVLIQETILTPFSRVVIYRICRLVNTWQMILLHKTGGKNASLTYFLYQGSEQEKNGLRYWPS